MLVPRPPAPGTRPAADPPPGPPDPPPERPDWTLARGDMVRALGLDPETVQTVIITATSVVAIADDYPEPYVQPAPEEAL